MKLFRHLMIALALGVVGLPASALQVTGEGILFMQANDPDRSGWFDDLMKPRG